MAKTRIDRERCQLYTSIANVSTLCHKLDLNGMTEAACDEGDFNIATHSQFNKTRDTEVNFHYGNAFMQDDDGDTFLHNAIILQKPAQAFQCICTAKSSIQLSIKNNICQTPLHLAVLTNQTSVARRLIVGGADIDSRDRDGNTALHVACREGCVDMAMTLLEPVRYVETKQNKYDIPYQRIPPNLELTNYGGKNCLHLAAMNDHGGLVKLFLEKGANINSKDVKTGKTILHSACVKGNMYLVKLLLQYSTCELNAKTYSGYYPFDLARAHGNYDVIKELAVAGAQYGDSDEEMES